MEGYTNIELLEGCFTDEMIQAFLSMHGYTKETMNQQKPSVMSELILSIILDECVNVAIVSLRLCSLTSLALHSS